MAHSTDAEQMTRENKLALVVGFGLILFVGILISDHFSIVQSQQPANLTSRPIDPLVAPVQLEGPSLIDLNPHPPRRETAESAGTQPSHITTPQHPQRDEPPVQSPSMLAANEIQSVPLHEPASTPHANRSADIGQISSDTPSIPGFVPVEEKRVAPPVKFHDVQRGESFYAICQRYYNDPSLIKALAKYNGVDNPDTLRAGHRLRIPPAEELGGTSRVAASSSSSSPSRNTAAQTASEPSKPRLRTYTVKAGDNLSLIAQRQLGSRKKWRLIYELNENVIDDYNHLKVGTVLRLPS